MYCTSMANKLKSGLPNNFVKTLDLGLTKYQQHMIPPQPMLEFADSGCQGRMLL